MTNREIAQIFENIADMLEIQGESRFKFLAYRRAGEVLRELPRDLQAYADEGSLTDIPGVGKAIADKIKELLETGKLDYYEKRKAEVPMGVLAIKRINGVGPKKAKLFWDELNITSLEALEKAAKAGDLQKLSGMGKKSEQKILDGIAALSRRTGRTPIGRAKPQAEDILKTLLALPQAIDGEIAGSIRRGRPTIGDVDILITGDNAAPIMEAFVNLDAVGRILGQGPTKSSVELHSGLQVDLRVLPESRRGAALHYFTGSKDHNVRMRQLARERKLSLNEEGFRPIDDSGEIIPDGEIIYCETEEKVFEVVDLPWIPPELREDAGEFELAQQHKLPDLITAEDIISDLHMHTTWSDGKYSIQEMAEAARDRGRQFIVITDHSQRSNIANGMSVERLMQQREAVREVDDLMGDDFRVLHGVEMDILEDGSMDYPDEVLADLDFVVASLHFGLRQPRERITERLLNAIRNPHVDCIGHMTGRLIGRREPADVDFDAVFDAAKTHDTILEINSNPRRLDLDSRYVRRAVEMGIKLAINTDAHRYDQMDLVTYGVMTARRGYAEADHVVNTWSYERFRKWLAARG